MAKVRKKIGELLVGWGVVTEEQVREAVEHAKAHRKRTGAALVELEMCGEDDVAKALATQFGLEYIDLEHQPVAVVVGLERVQDGHRRPVADQQVDLLELAAIVRLSVGADAGDLRAEDHLDPRGGGQLLA